MLGALNRVYINIGLYSEDWTTHFNPFFGFKPITPILIPTAEKYSSYWRATEAGTPSMAAFLVAAGQPDKLADAPGGGKYLSADADTLTRGKRVFAETCARCHSSKQPPEALKMMPDGCSGANYLQCFMRYWAYTKTDDYKAKMRDIVAAPDFLKENYLSTDARIPVTLLRTNACSPLGTNAIRGNIWDNFSSETYKSLPSVGNDNGAGSVHCRALAVPHAGWRSRLHPRALAHQRLVDRAVAAQQSARAVHDRPVCQLADECIQRVDRTAALAREA